MTEHIFALIGIVVVARWTYKAVVQFRKDLHSKPTPWLGLPWGP